MSLTKRWMQEQQERHSYFVVMIDYGKRGREAIVDPEITRRQVIARIASGEYSDVVFVHHIHDGICEDITDEIVMEVWPQQLMAAE